MLTVFTNIGNYVLLMQKVFSRPQKRRIFWNQLMTEINSLGLESIGIVAFISAFMGAVVAIQTAYNITSPLIPMTMVGFTVRQSVVLEFSPTVISLILAGKVGSRIASEIGTMESRSTMSQPSLPMLARRGRTLPQICKRTFPPRAWIPSTSCRS